MFWHWGEIPGLLLPNFRWRIAHPNMTELGEVRLKIRSTYLRHSQRAFCACFRRFIFDSL